MPYLLRFRGDTTSGADHVVLASRINIQTTDNFSIFMEVSVSQSIDFYRPIGGDSIFDNAPRVLCFGNGRIRLTNTSNANREWFTGVDLTTIETLEFRRVSGALNLYINGVLQSGGFTGDTNSYLGFQTIGGNITGSTMDHDLLRLKFEINGTLVHDYNPSSSNGTGELLIDDVGGNNGTLTNFPAGDAEWVFYGEVSNDFTSTINSVALLPTTTSELSNIKPSRSVSVSSNSFLPNSTTTLNNAAPEYELSVNSNSLLPVASVLLDNDIPSNTLSIVSLTPLPNSTILTNNANPEYLVGITSSTPLPSSSVLIDNTTPQYSTTITSSTLLPSSVVVVDNLTPTNSVLITSNALLPASIVTLDSNIPNGAIVISSTLLPVGSITLDNIYAGSSSINSNTLLPSSLLSLNNSIPEYDMVLNGSALLPTSSILLSNGNVIYYVGSKNSIIIPTISKNISIKPKSNFIQVR